MTSKVNFRTATEVFRKNSLLEKAKCERLSMEMVELQKKESRTKEDSEQLKNAYNTLKRKHEELQAHFSKAGCSILPGPTAPTLCVFKFWVC